ncbi:hypothetical protein ACU4GD_06245 [Cupriavidus basilensis]
MLSRGLRKRGACHRAKSAPERVSGHSTAGTPAYGGDIHPGKAAMNKLRSSRLLDRISPLVPADLRRMQAAAEARARSGVAGAARAASLGWERVNSIKIRKSVPIARKLPAMTRSGVFL